MKAPALIVGLLASTIAIAQTNVVVGPGYVREQKPVTPIRYELPGGWRNDPEAAKKIGVFAVLLPNGKTIDTTSVAITIAFQKKNQKVPSLATLDGFFRADVQNTLAQFPKMEGARWQPSGLDPTKVNYRSLEMWGDKSSPHRFVILETDDGFFSVSLTVETRADLEKPEFDAFFNSLSLQ